MAVIPFFKKYHRLDEVTLVKKGEFSAVDTFIEGVLCIPEKTNVLFCHTNIINLPLDLIGGREPRMIGDTCRMFFKFKRINKTGTDYYIWDGIVDYYLFSMKEHSQFSDENFDIYANFHDALETIFMDIHPNFIFETGKMNYRIVLIEKTKGSLHCRKPFWELD